MEKWQIAGIIDPKRQPRLILPKIPPLNPGAGQRFSGSRKFIALVKGAIMKILPASRALYDSAGGRR